MRSYRFCCQCSHCPPTVPLLSTHPCQSSPGQGTGQERTRLALAGGTLAPTSCLSHSMRLLLFQENAVCTAVEKSYPRGQPTWLQATREQKHYITTVENKGWIIFWVTLVITSFICPRPGYVWMQTKGRKDWKTVCLAESLPTWLRYVLLGDRSGNNCHLIIIIT